MTRGSSATRFAPPALLVARIKERLLDVVTRMIQLLGPTVGVAVLAFELPAGRGDPALVAALALLVLGALAVTLVPGRATRPRAAVVVAYFLALGGASLLHFGMVVGIAPFLVMGCVVAVIYFEWRGLVVALGGMTVLLAFGGYGFVSGALSVPAYDFGDPLAGPNIPRSLLGVLIGLGIIGVLVSELVTGFEQTIGSMTAAMEGERRAREEHERAQRALAQAQKLEAIGRLAGGVAHDFNNALVVILGSAEILRQDLERSDPRRAELASDIAHAARAASDITRQLLSFSRGEIGQAVDVPIDEVLAHLAKVLTRLLPRNIALEVSADSGGWAHMDRSQLEQVIVNLALNARDAMPNGGRLALRAHRLDGGGDPGGATVVIEVEDSGMGIDEETRASIFDPFFTTKVAGKGTGLGLFMARGIVEEAGGTLTCSSRVGEGSTFRVELPAATAHGGEQEMPRVSLAAEDVRVLLVEDRADVRGLMADVLRESGYAVVEAHDGTVAVEVLEEEGPFDILVTDAVMPGLPLGEVIERFREVCPGAPVLVCSGYVTEELVRRGILEGTVHALPKPFSPDELLEAVTRALLSSWP